MILCLACEIDNYISVYEPQRL